MVTVYSAPNTRAIRVIWVLEEIGAKAYALLFEAMREAGYAAIGNLAMHRRDHVVVVRAGKHGLIAHTMFYLEEVRAEFHLPRLLEDIRDLVQDQCQTDGTFKTTRLYCRLSVATVRRQLVARKGYSNEELPTIQTLTTKMNDLGFRLRKVAKCRVKKKSPRRMRSSRT